MSSKQEVSPVQVEATNVSNDMRQLYSDFKSGAVQREDADTLANIAGKNLKALSLIIADQIRADGHLSMVQRIGALEGQRALEVQQ
jgi:hypothetical protein